MERGVQLVHELGLLRGRGVLEARFVDALEEQGARLVAERGGDLGPQGVVAGEHVVVVGVDLRDPQLSVVVDVEHDVEVLGLCPVDHLLDAVHVRGVDGVGRGGGLVCVPGHRDADTAEALRPDGLEQLPGGLGVAPGRLVRDRVQRVAQVPTGLHCRDGVLGACRNLDRDACLLCRAAGRRERGGTGQPQDDEQRHQQAGQASGAAAAVVFGSAYVLHESCLSVSGTGDPVRGRAATRRHRRPRLSPQVHGAMCVVPFPGSGPGRPMTERPVSLSAEAAVWFSRRGARSRTSRSGRCPPRRTCR